MLSRLVNTGRTNLRTPVRPFGAYVRDACVEYLCSPGYAAKSSGVVLAAAGLLYMIGYHNGAYPIIGFCLAMSAGAAIPSVLIAADGRSGFTTTQAKLVVIGAISGTVGFVVAPVLYFVLNVGLTVGGVGDPAILAWAENISVSPVKPFWHIAVGSLTVYAAAPVLLLAYPLMAKTGLNMKSAIRYVWRRVEEREYEWRTVTTTLALSAIVVAWIPVLNVVIPGVIALVSARMFDKMLSTYA